MSASFYDLMKYAHTGLATADMTAFDKLRAQEMAGGVTIKTLTGVPPLSFRANGKPLISWSMSGNSQQTGTPTPDAAIMPDFVGERTKNLLDNQMLAEVSHRGVTYTKNADGSVTVFGTVSPSVSYCILMGGGAGDNNLSNYSTPIFKADDGLIFSTGTSVTLQARYTDGTYYNDIPNNQVITLAKDIGLVYVQVNTGATINKTVYPMIRRADISGSTYEPYGWKIPVTSAGQTQNVYLGQVQTVRRIKKLVLTGEEDGWTDYTVGENHFYLSQALNNGAHMYIRVFSTHYIPSDAPGASRPNNSIRQVPVGAAASQLSIRDDACTTINDFKTYLAAQYSTGTPVTVWYVLATPETGIVNEPLCKIGDYVDELNSTDAGVSIPTARGQNTLTVDTDLQPSSMTITYRE